MIAAVAVRNGASLLAVDGDFDQISTVVALRLEPG
ncbi:hypothetical protein BH23ACT2_BH23ACT2_22470 [soil metagenome]